MSQILIYFFIAISLSMDAFSLAISLGTTSISKNIIKKTSITIGIFHFIMPFLGSKIGKVLANRIIIKPNILLFIIFSILGLEMLKKPKEESIPLKINTILIIIISFGVSIDSFTLGIVLPMISNSIILACTIFSIVSCLSTYIGFYFGKKLHQKLKDYSNYVGGLLMIIIAIKYLITK